MDLDIKRYQTLSQLTCGGKGTAIASRPSLAQIAQHRDFRATSDPACRDYAIYLGKALQLTNILRDVRTDAGRGRIYLPLAELERSVALRRTKLLRGVWSERFEQVAEATAREARKYYGLARQTLPGIDRRSMAAAELMGSVYWRLLRKLERQRFQVFGPRLDPRVGKGQKTLLIFRTWCRDRSRRCHAQLWHPVTPPGA